MDENGSTSLLKNSAKVNYKKLLDTGRLPRAKRLRCRDPTDTLFPVMILESINHRVRIHYDGYDSDFDEWRDENDIELTDCNNSNEISCSLVPNSAPQYHKSFSLYVTYTAVVLLGLFVS